jgi:hypothetical protein
VRGCTGQLTCVVLSLPLNALTPPGSLFASKKASATATATEAGGAPAKAPAALKGAPAAKLEAALDESIEAFTQVRPPVLSA